MNVIALTPARTICVDRTEVTSAQYAAFRSTVTNVAPLDSRVPAGCSGMALVALTMADTRGELPRVSVSFCSAAYYCAASGKRLCGSLADGGPVVVGDGAADPAMEWEAACANAKPRNNYPWGTTDPAPAIPAKCHTRSVDADAGAPRVVGAVTTCGPSDGAGPFDMIGNVWEYVNGRRDGADGSASYTFARGGAYDGETVGAGCSTPHGVDGPPGAYAGANHANVGFRCCGELQP